MPIAYKKAGQPFLVLLTFLAVASFLMPSAAAAAEYYVALDGSDASGTGTAGNPFATVAYTIELANYGDTITLMPGEYTEHDIDIYNGVYVRSQYGPDSATFNGADLYTIFIYNDASADCVIDGFTFTQAPTALRVYFGQDIVIMNNRFLDCVCDSAGGAIMLYYSVAKIYNNLFSGNSAYEYGGALHAYHSNYRLYNNIFENNSAYGDYGYGGGVYTYGYYSEYSDIDIQNNIFRGNSAYFGGGIVCNSYYARVYNNLFLKNTADLGGGLYGDYGYEPIIYNNIFMQNSPDAMYYQSTTLPNDYNNYFGNTPTNGCVGCPPSYNNLEINPYFVDTAGGDFHLSDSSGLINQGLLDLAGLLEIDFDNQNRVLAGSIDIGPDEFADCSMSGDFAAAGDTAGCPELAVQFNARDLLGYYDSLTWDFGDSSYQHNILNPTHVYLDTGSFTVSLLMSTPCTTVVISREQYINIMNEPAVDFQADTLSGCAPFTVSFENLTQGRADSYLWDFGDLATSTESDPVHLYDSTGLYTVRLTAVNACGDYYLQKTGYIEVLPRAVADFSAEPLAGSAPLFVDFTDLSLNNPLAWAWDFGDGGIDSSQNPTYRFLFPGIYDVTLINRNECLQYPDTLVRENYITIYGFESIVYNIQQLNRYSTRFNFYVDSLYGLFNRTVSFRTAMPIRPTRGTVAINFLDSTAVLFDSTYLATTLSKDVPRGTYDFLLIATGSGNAPVDTQILQFSANSDSLIETSPLALDFGEVPQDSLKTLNLTVRNNVVFPDTFNLSVTNISASHAAFTVGTPRQFTLNVVSPTQLVPISFAPTELGLYQATLTIFSDDPAYPQWSLNLSGTGVLERTPPVVDTSAPYNNEKEFAVTDSILIQFSEALDESTLQPGAFVVRSLKTGLVIAGETHYDPENTSLVFRPAGGFAIQDSISVTISGIVADLVGNTLDGDGDGSGQGSPLDDYYLTFTTGLAVYPGDANNDGIVNEMDVLPLGVFWEESGNARESGSAFWSRQAARRWSTVRATYADCNGDGTVDGDDLEAIENNWGLAHAIEGSPAFFTGDELTDNAENFEQVNHLLVQEGLGMNGGKIQEIISAYISGSGGPQDFILGRNFPNPFNPITTIDFSVPHECHVILEVYNVLGQTVKMLIDEKQGAGFHSVVWDGTDGNGNPVPSGVYFYRMTADEFNQVRKMLLIR